MQKLSVVSLTLLMIGAVAANSLTRPQVARANVIGGPAAVVAGGSTALVYGLMTGGLILASGSAATAVVAGQTGNRGLYRAALVGLLIGVILDGSDDGSETMSFMPISAREAKRIGLSARSAGIINEQIDELNAISNEVSAELASLRAPTLEDSTAAWERNLATLDSETRDAVRELLDRLGTRKTVR